MKQILTRISYSVEMKEFGLMAEDLALSMEDLCLDHAASLGATKVKELEDRRILVENEVRHDRKLMDEELFSLIPFKRAPQSSPRVCSFRKRRTILLRKLWR